MEPAIARFRQCNAQSETKQRFYGKLWLNVLCFLLDLARLDPLNFRLMCRSSVAVTLQNVP